MGRDERRAPAVALPRKDVIVKRLLIGMLDLYGLLISPFVPTQCRFYPTCSCYMKEAIEKKGVARGILLGVKRLLRCNPLCSGGYDPVQ
jgi:uncharacterized protein